MGDNLDKTETGETLESGLNEAGNLASKGLDIANRISDKKSKDGSENTPGQENESSNSGDSAKKAESPENNQRGSGATSEHGGASQNTNSPQINSDALSTGNGAVSKANAEASANMNNAANAARSASSTATSGATSAASSAASAASSATSAGAASGVSAGASAGSAAGPVGTVIGAAVGAILPKIMKWLLVISIIGLLLIGGIIEELVPNIITKPVATTLGIIHGIYEKIKSVVKNMIDFFTGGSNIQEEEMVETLEEATQYCIDIIDEMLEASYEEATEDIRKLCEEKGYDYEATMDSFSGQGGIYNSANYAFIIATYSVSTDFQNVTVSEFKEKFRSKLKITYELSDVAETKEVYDSLPIYAYEPMEVTICQDEDTDEEGNTDHDKVLLRYTKKHQKLTEEKMALDIGLVTRMGRWLLIM